MSDTNKAKETVRYKLSILKQFNIDTIAMKDNKCKIYFILIFFVSITNNFFAQDVELFDGQIQQLPENKVKIYVNELFRTTNKECSKYYVITEFDTINYQFKDSITCYFTDNNNLYAKGGINNGKLHGEFKSYFHNGKLKMTFGYKYGKRYGIWKKFNTEGKLSKKVFYKDGTEFLISFYDDEGNEIIKNGEGEYEDYIEMTLGSNFKTKVTGKVKNGLPEGEWIFSYENSITSKEYFKDRKFEKGISISQILGETEYYNYFYATFTDRMLIESLSISIGYGCLKEKEKGIGLGTTFYKRLNKEFKKQNLGEIIKEDWFLIDISTGKNRKINEVRILSNSSEEKVNLIRQLILKLKNPLSGSRFQYSFSYDADFSFFPLIIKKSEPYNSFDGVDIELLN